MAARNERFFPAELMESQLRDLELPRPDEHVLTVRAAAVLDAHRAPSADLRSAT